MHCSHRILFAAGLTATLASPSQGAVTAFRFSDLDQRDPHMFMNVLGCRDVTDTPLFGFSFNGELQTNIQTDGDSDGLLDMSLVLAFDPLDPSAPSGTLRFGYADCTAPIATTACQPSVSPFQTIGYTNSTMGTCLATLPGTIRPYSPGIISSSAPCFVTEEFVFTLDLGGIPITLRKTRIAATYVGSPPVALANGLLRGFISVADANATIIPTSFPNVGGQALSSLFPGGGGNCASHSDIDVADGIQGWWFYLSFPAIKVPFTEATDAGESVTLGLETRVFPNPARRRVAIQYAMDQAGPVEISVHDAQGRWIADVAQGPRPAGSHSANWEGRDSEGRPMKAGVYFVRLAANGRTAIRRVALLP